MSISGAGFHLLLKINVNTWTWNEKKCKTLCLFYLLFLRWILFAHDLQVLFEWLCKTKRTQSFFFSICQLKQIKCLHHQSKQGKCLQKSGSRDLLGPRDTTTYKAAVSFSSLGPPPNQGSQPEGGISVRVHRKNTWNVPLKHQSVSQSQYNFCGLTASWLNAPDSVWTVTYRKKLSFITTGSAWKVYYINYTFFISIYTIRVFFP